VTGDSHRRSRHPDPAGHGRDSNWGIAHRDGIREPRVHAELLRDGGPELIERFMDELREAHLGIPLSDPDRPRASEQLGGVRSRDDRRP
jgi:hypothetical protein